MTRVLGIDVGHHSLKVAELELSSKAPQIIGLYEVRPREGQTKADALREFFSQSNIHSNRIGINLNNISAITKRFSFPFRDNKKVNLAVQGEWQDTLPFELDGYTIETRYMGRHDRTHFYLSGLSPSQQISDINDLCESAWIKPNSVVLDAEALGLLALSQRLPRTQEMDSYVVVDFGYEITKIALLRGSQALPKSKTSPMDPHRIEPEILEIRHIDKGSREWIQWIADKRKVSMDEALQWLIHRAEITPPSEKKNSIREDLSDDIKTALRPLVVEIYQTLQSCKVRTGHVPEALFITGSMCEVQGLQEFFAHELRLEVAPWPLFLGFNAQEAVLSPAHQKTFATALAVAHTFTHKKHTFLNFRRNTHPRKRFLTETLTQLLGPELKPSFALLGLGLFFIWVYSMAGSYLLSQQSSTIQIDLAGEFRRLDSTLGDRAANFVVDPVRAREIFEKLRDQKTSANESEVVKGPHPQIALLNDFSIATPSGVKIKLFETQTSQNTVNIKAEIAPTTTTDQNALNKKMELFVKNLQQSQYQDVRSQVLSGGELIQLQASWKPEVKAPQAKGEEQ